MNVFPFNVIPFNNGYFNAINISVARKNVLYGIAFFDETYI